MASDKAPKVVRDLCDALNDLIDENPEAAELLGASRNEGRITTMDVVNHIVAKLAPGNAILTLRETDGTLNGFSPRRDREAPATPVAQAPEL